MTIHTVQNGETIDSIAQIYQIPTSRLMRDNDLAPDTTLSSGQALMITNPTETYIVKEGDTIENITDSSGITRIELLRNNPQLAGINTLTPGDELIIRYHNKEKQIYVNGFANAYINKNVLIKTLPYLTYITILNYMVTDDAALVNIPDENVIAISKEYGVAPVMFVSAFNIYGVENGETIHDLLTNTYLQTNLIQNILDMLRQKGYYGLYLGFQNISQEDMPLYADYVQNVTDIMNREGYEVFVSLIPATFEYKTGETAPNEYFSEIGMAANYATLMTYQWMSSTLSQFEETGESFLNQYVNFAVSQIPPEKLFLGLGRIAYDWQYPYTQEKSSGNFISDFGALNLANQYNAPIYLDEASQAPYYYYSDLAGLEHFIWYKDARTVDAIVNLIIHYGLRGIAIWNVMYYFSPTFIVLNTQYDIVTLPNHSVD